jgi:hypothetical protein
MIRILKRRFFHHFKNYPEKPKSPSFTLDDEFAHEGLSVGIYGLFHLISAMWCHNFDPNGCTGDKKPVQKNGDLTYASKQDKHLKYASYFGVYSFLRVIIFPILQTSNFTFCNEKIRVEYFDSIYDLFSFQILQTVSNFCLKTTEFFHASQISNVSKQINQMFCMYAVAHPNVDTFYDYIRFLTTFLTVMSNPRYTPIYDQSYTILYDSSNRIGGFLDIIKRYHVQLKGNDEDDSDSRIWELISAICRCFRHENTHGLCSGCKIDVVGNEIFDKDMEASARPHVIADIYEFLKDGDDKISLNRILNSIYKHFKRIQSKFELEQNEVNQSGMQFAGVNDGVEIETMQINLAAMINTLTELVSCKKCNESLKKDFNNLLEEMEQLGNNPDTTESLITQLLWILKDDNPSKDVTQNHTRSAIFKFISSYYNTKCSKWGEEEKRDFFNEVVDVLDCDVKESRDATGKLLEPIEFYVYHLTSLIEEDIEEERKAKRYPILDGYLDYLSSVFSYTTPNMNPLGYHRRVHGDLIYVQKILDDVLYKIIDSNSIYFDYLPSCSLGQGQKWKIVAKCIKLLNIILKNYDIESIIIDDIESKSTKQNEMGSGGGFNDERLLDFMNVQQKNIFDGPKNNKDNKDIQVHVETARPKSAGYFLLASMFLAGSPLYKKIIEIIVDCSYDKIQSSKNRNVVERSDQSYYLLLESMLYNPNIFANARVNLSAQEINKSCCDHAYWMESALSQSLGFLHLCLEKESKFFEITEAVQKWWMLDHPSNLSNVDSKITTLYPDPVFIHTSNGNACSVKMLQVQDKDLQIDHGLLVDEQLVTLSLDNLPQYIVSNQDLWPILNCMHFRQLRCHSTPTIPMLTLSILEHLVNPDKNNVSDILWSIGTRIDKFRDEILDYFLVIFKHNYYPEKDELFAALGNQLGVFEFVCPEEVEYHKLQLSLMKFLLAGHQRHLNSITLLVFGFDPSSPFSSDFKVDKLIKFLPTRVGEGTENLIVFEKAYELLYKLIDSSLTSEYIIAELGRSFNLFFEKKVAYFKQMHNELESDDDLPLLYHNFAWFLDICSLIIFKCLTKPKFGQIFNAEIIVNAFLRDTLVSVECPFIFLTTKYCTATPLVKGDPLFEDYYFDNVKEPLGCGDGDKQFPSDAIEFKFVADNRTKIPCGCSCNDNDKKAIEVSEKIKKINEDMNMKDGMDGNNKYTVEDIEFFNSKNKKHHAACDVSNSLSRLISLFMDPKLRPGLQNSIYNNAFTFLATGPLMEDLALPLAQLLVNGSNHPEYLHRSLPPFIADPLAKGLLVIVNQITNDIVLKGLNFVSIRQLRELLEMLIQLMLGLNDLSNGPSGDVYFRDHFPHYFSELHVCVSKILQLPFKEAWSVTDSNAAAKPGLLLLNPVVIVSPSFTDLDKLQVLHMNLEVLHAGNRFIRLESALQLMNCLHTDMQNINSEVRLTALTVLNDIIYTLGKSMPLTYSQSRDVLDLIDDIKKFKPLSATTAKASLCHKCASCLYDQETLSLATSIINVVPSWSRNQSIWSSQNDFNEFVQQEYKDHNKLFAAAITLFHQIAAIDGGFTHLINLGLISIITELPYFTMCPPTTTHLYYINGGSAASAQNFLEVTISSYFTPIVEFMIIISNASVEPQHATQQYQYCLQFLHKNMSSIEHFLGTKNLKTFTSFSLVEKLTRLIKLTFHNIVEADNTVTLSDFSGGILDLSYFEKKFVPEAWELLKIFGFKSIPNTVWNQLQIPKNSAQNLTWWDDIKATLQLNLLMQNAQVKNVLNQKSGITFFDLEKAKICIDICRHTSSLLEIVTRRLLDAPDKALHLDIISIIMGFNDCSEIANLNFQSFTTPLIDEKSKFLRSQIYSTSLQVCEDLANVVYRYLSSNSIHARNLQNPLKLMVANGGNYPKMPVYQQGDSLERRQIIDAGARVHQSILLIEALVRVFFIQ